MNKKCVIWFVCSLLFVHLSLVDAMYSETKPIDIPGGTILPKRVMFYLTSSRIPYGTYNLTCDIENYTYEKEYPVVLLSYSGGTINGKRSSSKQFLLDHLINKYELDGIVVDGTWQQIKLSFINYDDTDPYIFKIA